MLAARADFQLPCPKTEAVTGSARPNLFPVTVKKTAPARWQSKGLEKDCEHNVHEPNNRHRVNSFRCPNRA